ncbi:MAG TPA: TRAP transporter substrate-binding protein, partial [Stellaceae bacterium]|nr:TRAP transporter substrate-binding protein [Stellaceae bacterium]
MALGGKIAVALGALALACTAIAHARADDVPTLILATALPPGNPLADQVSHPWADRVNAAAEGKLKIDIRDGMAIANLNNSYDRVVADVAQISWLTHGNFAGKFQRSNVGGLPFIAGESSEKASVALWRLYQDGVLDAEYDEVRPIMLAVLSQAGMHFRTKPASLSNLKGLKIIPPSKETGELAQRLGMAPIVLAVTQSYEALQRNTVDGVMLGWTAILSFKLQEVTSYHVEAALGTATGMMFIGKKRYESLPASAKAVLDKFSGEGESRELGKFWDRLQVFGDKLVKGLPNQTVIDAPAEQTAKWRAEAEPIAADWAKRTPDGEKVLKAFRDELAKVDAGQ